MTLNEILSSSFLLEVILKALTVGILVSVCSSILGVCLVLKRHSMIGDGLSHVGYFAVAVGACAGVSGTFSMEIAIPIVIAAAVLIFRLAKREGKLNGDSACAIVSTGSVAIGTILYNLTGGRSGDICSSLFGSSSIVTISTKDVVLSAVLSAIVILWFVLSYKTIFAVTFDENFSRAAGVKTEVFGLLLAVLTGLTIVVGMKLMGSIMISAILIFPPLTAMRLTKSFKVTVILSAVISALCFVAGFILACALSLQTGAAVVTVELIFFAITATIAYIRSKTKIRSRGKAAAQEV